VNVFAQEARLIASMTLLSRQVFLDELRQAPAYDVVIVDEAHNVAQRGSGTKRLVVLARELARKSSEGALLLLTATPHDGKTESFMSLLRLLDPHIELRDGRVATASASRLIVRRLKREVKLSGDRRFIEPAIQVRSTIPDAAAQEKALEPLLDAYLDHLREREAAYVSEEERAKAKGCSFLASILLKRTGSSVAALRATLRRRLGLPPDDEDSDAAVVFVETDASDPEDDDLDPSASQVTPPPDVDAKEAALRPAPAARAGPGGGARGGATRPPGARPARPRRQAPAPLEAARQRADGMQGRRVHRVPGHASGSTPSTRVRRCQLRHVSRRIHAR